MAHVYDGIPDTRQSDEHIPVSRFRPKYRALSDEEKTLHDEIKAKAQEMEALYLRAAEMRFPELYGTALVIGSDDQRDYTGAEYFSYGMKNLELSVMWTVKGLTS